MSSLSLLSVYLSGASLILLLTAVCDAQYDDYTPTPEYDSDYNATFDYSFFSNSSSEDLDKFTEPYIDQEEGEEGEEEEDTGGQQEDEKQVTVTTATTRGPRGTTAQGKVDVRSAASLPVSLEIMTLLWTLMILISLNTQQLQHTL